MSSYIFKKIVGNKFNSVVKELGFDDDNSKDNDVANTEDIIAEKNRQKAVEKERKERQAKYEKEREESRQKIRDKYSIKTKDESASTRTVTQKPVHPPSQPSTTENQSVDTGKKTTNAFDGLKKTFGWK